MNKKILINGLYVLSIVLLLVNIFYAGKDEDIEILYWLGMLIFAIAYIIQSNHNRTKT